MRITLLLFFTCLIFAACKTKKMATEAIAPSEKKQLSPALSNACMDNENGIIWSPVMATDLNAKSAQFSHDAKVFIVDEMDLLKVIEKNAKLKTGFVMSVPIYINNKTECVPFELINSETLDTEMQERYGIFSFKGIGGDYSSVRIDYNKDTGLRGYFKKDRQIILLESMMINNRRYYVSFDKESSTRAKEDFEE